MVQTHAIRPISKHFGAKRRPGPMPCATFVMSATEQGTAVAKLTMNGSCSTPDWEKSTKGGAG
jgi:hypothetical protein